MSPSDPVETLFEEAVHEPALRESAIQESPIEKSPIQKSPIQKSGTVPAAPDGQQSGHLTEAAIEPEEASWRLARELKEADEIVTATVTGHNKGGLLVRWHALQGFVPASQLIGLSSLHVEDERRAALLARHDEELQLKFIEVERGTNRLIFSERATEVTASAREELLRILRPGQVRVGVVTNLADFGAFVDLGGVEGLVHISELSWRRLTHPGDVVRPGQKVNVLVMEVDAGRGRVALSRKKLRTDPWIGVEGRYQPGQRVSGEVTSIAEFGVFVLLEEGLEGLLHVSELENALKQRRQEVDGQAGRNPAAQNPADVNPADVNPALLQTTVIDQFGKGTRIEAEVIYVSERKRRLALSLCHDQGAA